MGKGRGKEKSLREEIQRAKTLGMQEGFVDGTVTATTNIFIDALRRFPLAAQAGILNNVAQWHKTQENNPDEGGTRNKKDPNIVLLN